MNTNNLPGWLALALGCMRFVFTWVSNNASISLISLTSFLLLWGVFFLRIKLPVLIGLVLTVLGIILALCLYRSHINRVSLIVLLNLFYWLLIGVTVGGIHPADLLNLGFFDGDGKIFVAYLPLLFFTLMPVNMRYVHSALKSAMVIGGYAIGLFVIWWFYHPKFLSGGTADDFVGFHAMHNTAGLFFGVLATLFLIIGLEPRRWALVFLAGGLVFVVFGTASRQALVAFAVALLWYLVSNWRIRSLITGALIILITLVSLPIVAPQTFQRTKDVFTDEVVSSAILTAQRRQWMAGRERLYVGENHNLMVRMLYWTYAGRLFIDSPIFGIGFGRFNDMNTGFIGHRGLVYFATKGDRVISDLSAHNSYLHLLAELGVTGLTLLLLVWLMIFRSLGIARKRLVGAGLTHAYLFACQGLIVFVLVGALFDHGLGAPSLIIPVGIFVGSAYGLVRKARMLFEE